LTLFIIFALSRGLKLTNWEYQYQFQFLRQDTADIFVSQSIRKEWLDMVQGCLPMRSEIFPTTNGYPAF
jgi:hypothetical protein